MYSARCIPTHALYPVVASVGASYSRPFSIILQPTQSEWGFSDQLLSYPTYMGHQHHLHSALATIILHLLDSDRTDPGLSPDVLSPCAPCSMTASHRLIIGHVNGNTELRRCVLVLSKMQGHTSPACDTGQRGVPLTQCIRWTSSRIRRAKPCICSIDL
jgi:hypothetical protein